MAFLSLNKRYIAAGETFRLIITDSDGEIGDTLPYTLSGEGITSSNFVGQSSLSGLIAIGANKSGFKDFTTSSDLPTGEEYATITVSSFGMTDIYLKVYSDDHYLTAESKIELGDTFDVWRKKTNGFIARLNTLESSTSEIKSQTIIGDGITSDFALDFIITSTDTYSYDVNIDGIAQNPSEAYTINELNNSIEFSETPNEFSSISVIHKYEISQLSRPREYIDTWNNDIISNSNSIFEEVIRATSAEEAETARATAAEEVNATAIAALPIAGSFMAPDHSYSTNSNALAAGFVENQLFLNTTSHNLSGVYSDNYTLLSQYSGASAAYSLRRLSSNTTSALKIRRTGDNEEVDVLFDSNDQVSLQSPIGGADDFILRDATGVMALYNGDIFKRYGTNNAAGHQYNNFTLQSAGATSFPVFSFGTNTWNWMDGIASGGPSASVDLPTDEVWDADWTGTPMEGATFDRTLYGTTLDEFVNTEIVTYTSDFSGGNDGWGSSNGTRDGDIDGIGPVGDVRDDNLRFNVGSGTSDLNGLNLNNLTGGLSYNISFDILIPSSNLAINGFGVGGRPVRELIPSPPLDVWISHETTINPTSSGAWYVLALQSGSDTVIGNGTDVFYIRNVVITDTSKDGHVVTWYDQSGNGNDATQPSASQQPKIVDTGVLVVDRDGKVAINGKGATLKLPAAAPMLSADGTYSLFAVCDLPDQTFGNTIRSNMFYITSATTGGTSSTRKPLIYQRRDTGGIDFTSSSWSLGSIQLNVAAATSLQLLTNIGNPTLSTNNNLVYVDGTLSGFSNSFTDVNTDTTTSSAARLFDPLETVVETFLSEVIYYPSDQSAKRVAIEANINNHYFPITGDLFLRA